MKSLTIHRLVRPSGNWASLRSWSASSWSNVGNVYNVNPAFDEWCQQSMQLDSIWQTKFTKQLQVSNHKLETCAYRTHFYKKLISFRNDVNDLCPLEASHFRSHIWFINGRSDRAFWLRALIERSDWELWWRVLIERTSQLKVFQMVWNGNKRLASITADSSLTSCFQKFFALVEFRNSLFSASFLGSFHRENSNCINRVVQTGRRLGASLY